MAGDRGDPGTSEDIFTMPSIEEDAVDEDAESDAEEKGDADDVDVEDVAEEDEEPEDLDEDLKTVSPPSSAL